MIYLQQLFTDTGCSLEDLPEALDDRDEWWERVWWICARIHDDDDDDDDDDEEEEEEEEEDGVDIESTTLVDCQFLINDDHIG